MNERKRNERKKNERFYEIVWHKVIFRSFCVPRRNHSYNFCYQSKLSLSFISYIGVYNDNNNNNIIFYKVPFIRKQAHKQVIFTNK